VNPGVLHPSAASSQTGGAPTPSAPQPPPTPRVLGTLTVRRCLCVALALAVAVTVAVAVVCSSPSSSRSAATKDPRIGRCPTTNDRAALQPRQSISLTNQGVSHHTPTSRLTRRTRTLRLRRYSTPTPLRPSASFATSAFAVPLPGPHPKTCQPPKTVENSKALHKHWRKYHPQSWHTYPTQLSKIELDTKKACAARAGLFHCHHQGDFAT
jgi:hypothetical protein